MTVAKCLDENFVVPKRVSDITQVHAADLKRIRDAMDENGDGTLQRSELGSLPLPGETAPDFELGYADREGVVTLSSCAGEKPVALIFGSYT